MCKKRFTQQLAGSARDTGYTAPEMVTQDGWLRGSARLGARIAGLGRGGSRRGRRSVSARLVVGHLCAVFLIGGIALGYALAPRPSPAPVVTTRTPPPATPPPPGTRWVEVKTTGYCPCARCCGKDADGYTARMRDVSRFPHGIAVDPELIPYEMWLDIPGYGHHMVDDTGGAMRQSGKRDIVHMDLRFKTHAQARRWGVRWMWVAIPQRAPAADRYGYPRPDAAR